MRLRAVVTSFGVAIGLLGCGAEPLVTYRLVDQADPKGFEKFVLAHSLIKVDYKFRVNTVSGNSQVVGIVTTTVPTDASAGDVPPDTYAIIPSSGWGVKTELKVTYADNTRLITSLGVEVEDNRVKLLSEVAAAVIAAAPLMMGGAPTPERAPKNLPFVIDPGEYLAKHKNTWVPVPSDPQAWQYFVEVGAPPKDALSTAEFFRTYARDTGVFPYSACRDGVVSLRRAGEDTPAYVFAVKLALRDSVLTAKLPSKGKIDMHSECGVNITSEKSDTSSTWAIISEAIKQAVAIKKAYTPKSP